MGSFANSLFRIMLGWLQGAVSAVWSAFTTENGSPFFNWIGKNWIWIAGILCMTGLIADLFVYILRWRPYKVWKSFFSRAEAREDDEPAEESEPLQTGERRKRAGRIPSASATERREEIRSVKEQEAADADWQDERDAEKRTGTELPPEPAHVQPTPVQPLSGKISAIRAGYSVPDDSPYRRPVKGTASTSAPVPVSQETNAYTAVRDRSDPVPVIPKRRRRINVAELFNDPEEELRQIESPQQVIDSRKAYRDPVYPRGWNKSEGNGE